MRADFIKYFLNFVKADTKIISTTGYTSRELNEIRKNENKLSGEDFYMVGGMGHAAALGSIYAKFKKKKGSIHFGWRWFYVDAFGCSSRLYKEYKKKN